MTQCDSVWVIHMEDQLYAVAIKQVQQGLTGPSWVTKCFRYYSQRYRGVR